MHRSQRRRRWLLLRRLRGPPSLVTNTSWTLLMPAARTPLHAAPASAQLGSGADEVTPAPVGVPVPTAAQADLSIAESAGPTERAHGKRIRMERDLDGEAPAGDGQRQRRDCATERAHCLARPTQGREARLSHRDASQLVRPSERGHQPQHLATSTPPGSTTQRAVAHSGHGGGLGYSFRSWFHSQPHVCFCECKPCKHAAFTGTPSEHTVLPSTQQAKDCIIALRRHVALLTVPA